MKLSVLALLLITLILNSAFTPGEDDPAGDGSSFTANINGQVFDSFRDTSSYAVSYAATGVTNTGPYFSTPGAAGQAYGSYNTAGVGGINPDYTLDNAAYSNDPNATITLGNLVQGHSYLMQFWVEDPRGNLDQRSETISSGGATSGSLSYGTGPTGDGQWVSGTFTADSSLQQMFTLFGTPDNSGDGGSAQVNLLQLRDITVTPEPASLGLLGIAGMGLLLRRTRIRF